MDQDKQAQLELASHIGRLLREAFGKGPQSIHVSIRRPFVIVYLRSFLSPTEKILLDQDQVFSMQNTRDLVMRTLIPEIKAYTTLIAGMNLREFYYDWGLHNHSGVFVGIDEEEGNLDAIRQEPYLGKEQFLQEISNISDMVQKVPEEIYSCRINDRTLLVVRNGILINIEKELIRLGFEENLKLAKRNLEKRHLHSNNHFERILQTKIVDVFADWDFHYDRSVFVFMLQPGQ